MKTKKVFVSLMVIAWMVLPGANCLLAQPEGETAQGNAKLTAEPDVDYKAQDYRDPFDSNIEEIPVKEVEVPVAVNQEVVVKPPELEIQGVFWGSSYPQAIIDNMVLKVGDNIKGAKIVAISKDGIKILFSGKDFTVTAPGVNSRVVGKAAAEKKKKAARAAVKKDEKTIKKAAAETDAETEEEKPPKTARKASKEASGERNDD